MFLTRVERGGLASDVYQRIRDAIFSGELTTGARLDVRELAEALGVSSQPVKEALSRLSLEGLVVIRPRVGTFVRTLDIADVEHILDARLMVEMFSVTHMPAEIDGDRLNQLEQAAIHLEQLAGTQPFSYMTYNETDIRFHETLVEMADNPELVRLYRSLHAHYVTARGYYGRAHEKAIANEKDHRVIFEAVRAGRGDKAAKAVQDHIMAAKNGLRQLMKL